MSYDEFRDTLAHLLIGKFAKVQRSGSFPCPRCGQYLMDSDPIRNALSRHADIQVCDACGMDEAIRDVEANLLPLREWAIFINPAAFLKGDEKARRQ